MSCAGSLFGTSCGCGCVRGVGASEEAAFEYLQKVDVLIESLDADVTLQTRPGGPPNNIGQGFIGAWNDFVNRLDVDLLVDDEPFGWREFRKDASDFLDRFLFGDLILKRTGEFERQYVEFRRAFIELGGSPSLAEPKVGPPASPLEGPPEDAAITGLTILLGTAVVVGLAYGLKQVSDAGFLRRS